MARCKHLNCLDFRETKQNLTEIQKDVQTGHRKEHIGGVMGLQVMSRLGSGYALYLLLFFLRTGDD